MADLQPFLFTRARRRRAKSGDEALASSTNWGKVVEKLAILGQFRCLTKKTKWTIVRYKWVIVDNYGKTYGFCG